MSSEKHPLVEAVERKADEFFLENSGTRPTHAVTHRDLAQRLVDALQVWPRMPEPRLKLMGLPVYTDILTPRDEIHFADAEGKLIGKISVSGSSSGD